MPERANSRSSIEIGDACKDAEIVEYIKTKLDLYEESGLVDFQKLMA